VWNSENHTYKGEFKNGEQSGLGEYTWPDGDIYYGEFKNNKIDGNGVYNYSNGTSIVISFGYTYEGNLTPKDNKLKCKFSFDDKIKIDVINNISQKSDKLEPDINSCSVCMDGPKKYAFVKCGHLCICETCKKLMNNNKCPICRMAGDVIKIFL